MKRRRYLSICVGAVFALACFASSIPSAHAENKVEPIAIHYPDGYNTKLDNQGDYRIENGRFMLWAGYVARILPFAVASKGVYYLNNVQTLQIDTIDLDAPGERRKGFTIAIGEKKFTDYVRNQTIAISQPAELINGRVYVPLRTIAEAYGSVVQYTKSSNGTTISIQSSNK
ncbi:stalk domain-containing protein [Paenibacillus sp. OV219]|uniref:stalk domain-containing protein n=1 Tax=Paenibacillus sp. OV219 TaxID=1884377 RepID=UPI0008B1D128|nr:stalk domain-containing protein [Paenibacillus sp. OV219]SEN66776.1 Copper amine oxidase N-terminal domain-containing protein [Paenibacillus sp. OV219]